MKSCLKDLRAKDLEVYIKKGMGINALCLELGCTKPELINTISETIYSHGDKGASVISRLEANDKRNRNKKSKTTTTVEARVGVTELVESGPEAEISEPVTEPENKAFSSSEIEKIDEKEKALDDLIEREKQIELKLHEFDRNLDATSDELKKTRDEATQLKLELKRLRKQITNVLADAKDAQSRLDQLMTQMGTLKQTRADYSRTWSELSHEIEALHQELLELKKPLFFVVEGEIQAEHFDMSSVALNNFVYRADILHMMEEEEVDLKFSEVKILSQVLDLRKQMLEREQPFEILFENPEMEKIYGWVEQGHYDIL